VVMSISTGESDSGGPRAMSVALLRFHGVGLAPSSARRSISTITTLVFPAGRDLAKKMQLAPEGRPRGHDSVTAAVDEIRLGWEVS